MKVVHVVPHIHHEASGPSYAVPRLCEALAARGNEVELACLGPKKEITGVAVRAYSQWPVLKRLAVSPRHALELHRRAAEVDVVHNHGLWSMVNLAAGWVVPGRRAKLVFSPHGTLLPMALDHSRRVKRIAWPLQFRGLKRAALLHATSVAEYREIRALGLEVPVAVIPNGIDVPEPICEIPVPGSRTLLFLGRIHPIKGIEHLLRAWRTVQGAHSDWRLVIVGEGRPAYEQEMKALSRQLRLKRVEFYGPLYGAAKARMYRAAELFVLPTHSENFGVVVAEALAHGCPVVVSKGAPWREVETEQCGWWVENRIETLAAVLHEALSRSPEVLERMGRRGRDWMDRDFSWESVATRMERAYRWLAEPGIEPDSIRLD